MPDEGAKRKPCFHRDFEILTTQVKWDCKDELVHLKVRGEKGEKKLHQSCDNFSASFSHSSPTSIRFDT